jgi:hypothetical protein
VDSEGAAQRRVKRWSVTQEGAPYKVQCTCSCGFCCRDSVARSTCACNCQLNCTMRRMRCDNITTHLRRARCRRGRDNAPELQDNHSIPHIPMRTGLPAVVLLVSALSRAHGFAPVMEIAPASAHGLTQADRSAVLPFARPKRKAQRRRARVHCKLSVAQGSTRGTLGGREQMLLPKARPFPSGAHFFLFP